MNLRLLGMVMVVLIAAGCRPPSAARVSTSELRFKSHVENVTTFDLKLRSGDMICWCHGVDGTEVSHAGETDRATELTLSITQDRLVILIQNRPTQSIPIVTARLLEKPDLRDDKWLVGHYIRKLGVVESPETPLYLYVKRQE